jgi:hypothetical protein
VYPAIAAAIFFIDAKEKRLSLYLSENDPLTVAIVMDIPHDECHAADQYPGTARCRIADAVTFVKMIWRVAN